MLVRGLNFSYLSMETKIVKEVVLNFLNKQFKFDGSLPDQTEHNAVRSGMGDLWREVTKLYRESKLRTALQATEVNTPSKLETAFMAGFYCGVKQTESVPNSEDHA